MSGQKGRSGRKPLSTAERLARGTWRVHRHGPRPDVPLALVATRGATGPTMAPVTDDLERLLAMGGEAFARRALTEFKDWTVSDEMLLRLASEQIDRVRELRALVAKDGLIAKSRRGSTLHPAARAERQSVTVLAGLLAKLNLR